jgi:hypothetical protein
VNVLQVWGQEVPVTFLVDLEPPVVSLAVNGVSVPVAVPTPNATATVRAADRHSAANMTVQLRVLFANNGSEFVKTFLPLQAAAEAGVWDASFFIASLADGTYVVEVKAWDGVGNAATAVSVTVTVDTVAPAVSVPGFMWPAYTSVDPTRVCVLVSDTWARDCSASAAANGRAPTPLLLDPSIAVLGGVVFCGDLRWDGIQGNFTMVVTAVDPAGNRGTASPWILHDSVAPAHRTSLDASPVCVSLSGVTSCREAAGVTVSGDCDGGVSSADVSPCAVQWAVVVLQVLQASSCAGSNTTSVGEVVVPAELWVTLPPGSFHVDASAVVAGAVSSAGGGRLPVRVAVVTRAVDDAGTHSVERALIAFEPDPARVGEAHGKAVVWSHRVLELYIVLQAMSAHSPRFRRGWTRSSPGEFCSSARPLQQPRTPQPCSRLVSRPGR